jgi:hypothetical protein
MLLVGQDRNVFGLSPKAVETIAAQIDDVVEQERRVTDLASSVPALAPLLEPRRIGEAMCESGGMAKLATEIGKASEGQRAAIESWLTRQ